jgi:putative addiction module CopG family antidote
MHAILWESPPALYDPGMDDLTLAPELERFAAEAIAAGRYRDKAELLAAGVSLLQRQERARADFLASVLAAKADGDCDGYLTGDEVAAQVRASIARRSATPA